MWRHNFTSHVTIGFVDEPNKNLDLTTKVIFFQKTKIFSGIERWTKNVEYFKVDKNQLLSTGKGCFEGLAEDGGSPEVDEGVAGHQEGRAQTFPGYPGFIQFIIRVTLKVPWENLTTLGFHYRA